MKRARILEKESDRGLVQGSFIETLRKLLADGADDWNLSPKQLLGIMALPYLIAISGAIAALFGKEIYKLYTEEDGVVEYLQVVCWTASLVLSILIVRHKLNMGDKFFAALFMLLSVFLFFIIGEELSWGQRLIGWGTPESLQSINKQDETNLHNIYGIGLTFKWLHLVVGAYCTFMPIIVLRAKRMLRYKSLTTIFVPHYTLIPFFSLYFIWHVYRRFFGALGKRHYYAITNYTEVIELILASGLTFFLLYLVRQFKSQKKQSRVSDSRHLNLGA